MSTNIKDCKQPGLPPMEAGTYFARCCGVIDLGEQLTSFEGKSKETKQLLLMFEFPSETIERDGEKKPRWMSQIYTMSVHEKSRLRQALKSWRGRDFTDQELEDFDVVKVLNAPCTITVSHTEKGGNTYANIATIGKIMKGVEVPDAISQYHFDIDEPETWKCFQDLPEWVQAKINGSLTLKIKGVQISKVGEIFDVGTPPKTGAGDFTTLDDDDEDLPF